VVSPHDFIMTTVAKIKQAVKHLPSTDYRKFRRWFEAQDERTWDRQIERDSKGGKFDRLIAEAQSEFRAGVTRKL
jgi:hypothetical protein